MRQGQAVMAVGFLLLAANHPLMRAVALVRAPFGALRRRPRYRSELSMEPTLPEGSLES